MTKIRILNFSLALILMCACMSAANAQTYEVKIRQINPDGPVNETTCIVSQKQTCFMTAEISPLTPPEAGDNPYLDVGMRFKENKMNVNFIWGRDYAFTETYQLREKGIDIPLDSKGQGYGKALLLTHGPMHQGDQNVFTVWPPEWMLAEIEIGVRRVPDSVPE